MTKPKVDTYTRGRDAITDPPEEDTNLRLR